MSKEDLTIRDDDDDVLVIADADPSPDTINPMIVFLNMESATQIGLTYKDAVRVKDWFVDFLEEYKKPIPSKKYKVVGIVSYSTTAVVRARTMGEAYTLAPSLLMIRSGEDGTQGEVTVTGAVEIVDDLHTKPKCS